MLLSVLKYILDLEDLEVLKTLRSCVGIYFFHFNSDISIVVDCTLITIDILKTLHLSQI